MEMNHWERIEATLAGDAVDRPPICLWRHWPVEDESPDTLADAMVRWQREYDWDLVKHAPNGNYVIHDWGGETSYIPEKSRGLGVSTVTRWAVTSAHGWPELAQLDVTRGHLGEQLRAVRQVAAALDGSVPILQTVFSPLNIAPKSGDADPDRHDHEQRYGSEQHDHDVVRKDAIKIAVANRSREYTVVGDQNGGRHNSGQSGREHDARR